MKGVLMYRSQKTATRDGMDAQGSPRVRLGLSECKRLTGAIVLTAAGVVLLGTLLAGCSDSPGNAVVAANPGSGVGSTDTITVVGAATVTSPPDEALLTLTVESDGKDPAASMNKNSAAVAAVLERLKGQNIDEADIKTANVSVYPIRTYDPQTGAEKLTGYRSQNSITVTLADTKQVGKVLSAAVEAGANNVSGPIWRLSDDTAVTAKALKKAAENARTKAEALADALGVSLGGVVMISENSVQGPVYPTYAGMLDSAALKAGGGVSDTPINAGTLDVTATVTVAFAIKR
jgi:uncharacterized protein YggE